MVELGAKIMLENKYNKGFTLIEIVAILILIGILMAVAASKYFDMRDEAQKRAALATVAEAQSRINSVFAEKILSGETCADARNHASKLENIADDNSFPYVFGDYCLVDAGTGVGDSNVLKVNVGLISDSTATIITSATLYLPECGSKNSGSGGTGDGDNDGDEDNSDNDPNAGNGDWWLTNQQIVDKYGSVAVKWGMKLDEFVKTLIPGSIVKFLGGYIITDYQFGIHFLNSTAQTKDEQWARHDGNSWTKAPINGSYYLGENDEVYVYVGESSNPTVPTSTDYETLKQQGWIKVYNNKSTQP